MPNPYETMIPGVEPRAGLTLVAGSKVYATRTDRRSLFTDALGLDIEGGDGVDIVHDLEQPIGLWDFQHIDCVSVLEHVKRPWLAAKNLQDALARDGTIFICVPWVWRWHSYGGDHFRFSPSALPILFDAIEWTELWYYSQRDGLTKKYPKPTPDAPFLIPRCETFGFGVKR